MLSCSIYLTTSDTSWRIYFSYLLTKSLMLKLWKINLLPFLMRDMLVIAFLSNCHYCLAYLLFCYFLEFNHWINEFLKFFCCFKHKFLRFFTQILERNFQSSLYFRLLSLFLHYLFLFSIACCHEFIRQITITSLFFFFFYYFSS